MISRMDWSLKWISNSLKILEWKIKSVLKYLFIHKKKKILGMLIWAVLKPYTEYAL